MAEKKDITKLSKVELVEMLQRQEKLFGNRKFINSLPDKGEKIHKLVEKLKGQLTIREQADDLANRFKRISLAQSRNTGQNVELDSDDDEYCDDEDNCDSMVGNEKGALVAATQVDVSEESPVNKEKTPKRSGKWAYDSAVTQVKAHVFEKAKVLSLEESRQLQLKQKEEYEALKAKQAAERLFEHISKSSSQGSPSNYEFSSAEAKMTYREEEEEEENEDSEPEDKLYEQEQEQFDED